MSPKNKNYDILKRIDWITVLLTLGLAFFGMIAIASATCTAFDPDTQTFLEYVGSLSSSLPLTQFIYFCLGVILIIVLLFVDYSNIREFCNIIYWGCVALLVITLIFGANQRGLKGWLRIGSVGIQTSEICKPLIILVLAREFAERTENTSGGIEKFRDLLPILWRFLIPVVLIAAQPDLGTAMVYLFILIGLLFMSKTSFKILGPMFGAALAMLPIAWLLMSEDQKLKTDQALLTAPISLFGMVMGKFLAAFIVFGISACVTLVYGVVISVYAMPDWPVLLGEVLGLLLLGAALIAIGMFISALTENQVIAAIGSFAVMFFLAMFDSFASMIQISWIAKILTSLSLASRYTDFTMGYLNLANVLFFVSLAGVFIFLTVRVFEKKRWS